MYPVIKHIPDSIKVLKRKEKVMALSRFARQSAVASAVKSKFPIPEFEKDDQGVPRPSNGIFWSISHKEDIVAGVVSMQRVGIDIEKIKFVSSALFNRVVDGDEAMIFKTRKQDQDHERIFFRAFTAKEAVLKKTGIGIKGLSKTKIVDVINQENLIVGYSGQKYMVENFYFDGYLAALTKDKSDIEWIIE